jgi:hypothetical protein
MTKARAKTNAIRNAGQKTPGGVATRDPEASHDGASPKESLQKQETLRWPAHQANRRGFSMTDSFGASPVSSALDHSAGRDPG